MKAHRSASGGKGGAEPGQRARAAARPRSTLTDCDCQAIAFLLTGSQVADSTAGSALLEQVPAARILHGDEVYDSNATRRQVEKIGTMPNIPPKANRRWKNCFSPVLYRDRNAIERMFCRMKDFRRVATRYARNAVNFLAAVCYWL